MIDTNKDGKISNEELQATISKVLDKAKAEVIEQLFEDMDMNKNGGIDYNEFLTVAAKKESLLADENLE